MSAHEAGSVEDRTVALHVFLSDQQSARETYATVARFLSHMFLENKNQKALAAGSKN